MVLLSTMEQLVVSNFSNGKYLKRKRDTIIIKLKAVIRMNVIFAFLTILVPFFALSF